MDEFRTELKQTVGEIKGAVDRIENILQPKNGKAGMCEKQRWHEKQIRWIWIILGIVVLGSGSAVTINWQIVSGILKGTGL